MYKYIMCKKKQFIYIYIYIYIYIRLDADRHGSVNRRLFEQFSYPVLILESIDGG
jgi:hypothetical protein